MTTERPQHSRHDDGFTLIELAVVILIIGILLAIAIPNFLGVRRGAEDKAAQSALRTSLTLAKSSYGNAGSFANAGATALTEPGLTFTASSSSSPTTVSVAVSADNQTWVAAVKSQTQNVCWWVKDSATGTTGTQYAKQTSSSTCTASTTDPGSNWSGWQSRFPG